MKWFQFSLLLSLLIFTDTAMAMSVKSRQYNQCPKSKNALLEQYNKSHTRLLSLLGKGERGKLDTPQKQEAADEYRFYAECLKRFGHISSDTQINMSASLSKCDVGFDKSKNILSVDMEVEEKEAYGSLKRVEISVRNSEGKEFFRAMNNRMDHPEPIPPNAFGVYSLNKKGGLLTKSVQSTGQEAQTLIDTEYGHLVPGCKTLWREEKLTIHWQISPKNWYLPDGKVVIFSKIVPVGKEDAKWVKCTVLQSHQGNMPEGKITYRYSVRPYFVYKDTEKKANKGRFTWVTLVHLERTSAKSKVQRWEGDNKIQYVYKVISKKRIDLLNLLNHTLNLVPGFYRFEYNDVKCDPPGGFYGKSDIIEIGSGKDMEIPVWMESAI